MRLADYLRKINLYNQIAEGIEKYFGSQFELTEMIFRKMETCEFAFKKSINSAGDCRGIARIRLNSKVAERPADRDSTMLHEVGHFIRNCKLNFYGESDGGGVRFQMVSRGGYTGLRKVRNQRRSSHGHEWKAIMLAIGGSPERCHDYNYLRNDSDNGYKHKYTCKDCGYVYHTKRKLKNLANRYHIGCKRKPNHGRLIHEQLR